MKNSVCYLGLKLSANVPAPPPPPPELLEPVRIDATDRESSSLDIFICCIFINIETTGSGTFSFNPIRSTSSPKLLTPFSVSSPSAVGVLEANDSVLLDNATFNNSEKKFF